MTAAAECRSHDGLSCLRRRRRRRVNRDSFDRDRWLTNSRTHGPYREQNLSRIYPSFRRRFLEAVHTIRDDAPFRNATRRVLPTLKLEHSHAERTARPTPGTNSLHERTNRAMRRWRYRVDSFRICSFACKSIGTLLEAVALERWRAEFAADRNGALWLPTALQ